MLANTFEGYGLGNVNFGSGVDGRWEFPVAAERPYAYARSSWAPVGLKGLYTWSDESSSNTIFFTAGNVQGATTVTVINVATATNNNTVATVTLSASPLTAGLTNNDYITVSGAGDLFDTRTNTGGVYTFNSAGVAISNINTTSNTFTYVTTDNVPVANTQTLANNRFFRLTVVDSATETPSYSPVTTEAIDAKYAGGTGTPNAEVQYNVPGNIAYNPDNNVDFIIKSNED